MYFRMCVWCSFEPGLDQQLGFNTKTNTLAPLAWSRHKLHPFITNPDMITTQTTRGFCDSSRTTTTPPHLRFQLSIIFVTSIVGFIVVFSTKLAQPTKQMHSTFFSHYLLLTSYLTPPIKSYLQAYTQTGSLSIHRQQKDRERQSPSVFLIIYASPS
jgi:hypothetical protein